MNTVQFTFTKEYAESGEVFEYYCDMDDETGHYMVYVEDVSEVLMNDMNDEDLCEFFGLDSAYLIGTNR